MDRTGEPGSVSAHADANCQLRWRGRPTQSRMAHFDQSRPLQHCVHGAELQIVKGFQGHLPLKSPHQDQDQCLNMGGVCVDQEGGAVQPGVLEYSTEK